MWNREDSLWECLLADLTLGLDRSEFISYRLGMNGKKQLGNSALQMEMRFLKGARVRPKLTVSVAKMETLN